ncbi:hypothetical protein [Streptomyces sp. TRM49041]|uniref:hypothetical protein n=1 Tax=Streptomyces sp. TRM49041 TaxID=2603216 RepID=UPI0011EC9CE9|nr:hypothetical protein [Streptomyces sp. TRM49041]
MRNPTGPSRGSLVGQRVQSLDLTERGYEPLSVDVTAAVFLGRRPTPDAAAKVRADGALAFPPVPDVPFDPCRGLLYTPDELFTGLGRRGYPATSVARMYVWRPEALPRPARPRSGSGTEATAGPCSPSGRRTAGDGRPGGRRDVLPGAGGADGWPGDEPREVVDAR